MAESEEQRTSQSKLHVGRRLVEHRQAVHLRREDGVEIGGALAGDEAVPHHAGGMDDAAQRRPEIVDQRGHVGGPGDVDGAVLGVDAAAAQALEDGAAPGVERRAPGEDDPRSRRVGRHRLGQDATDAAGAAGDQVGPAGPPRHGRRAGLAELLEAGDGPCAGDIAHVAWRGVERLHGQEVGDRLVVVVVRDQDELGRQAPRLAGRALDQRAEAAQRGVGAARRDDELDEGRLRLLQDGLDVGQQLPRRLGVARGGAVTGRGDPQTAGERLARQDRLVARADRAADDDDPPAPLRERRGERRRRVAPPRREAQHGVRRRPGRPAPEAADGDAGATLFVGDVEVAGVLRRDHPGSVRQRRQQLDPVDLERQGEALAAGARRRHRRRDGGLERTVQEAGMENQPRVGRGLGHPQLADDPLAGDAQADEAPQRRAEDEPEALERLVALCAGDDLVALAALEVDRGRRVGPGADRATPGMQHPVADRATGDLEADRSVRGRLERHVHHQRSVADHQRAEKGHALEPHRPVRVRRAGAVLHGRPRHLQQRRGGENPPPLHLVVGEDRLVTGERRAEPLHGQIRGVAVDQRMEDGGRRGGVELHQQVGAGVLRQALGGDLLEQVGDEIGHRFDRPSFKRKRKRKRNGGAARCRARRRR